MTDQDQQRLWELCATFIKDNGISCAETISQKDRVISNAFELIESITEIVGYTKTAE